MPPRPITTFFPAVPAQPVPPKRTTSAASAAAKTAASKGKVVKKAASSVPTPAPTPAPAKGKVVKKAASSVPTPATTSTTTAQTPASAKGKAVKKTPSRGTPSGAGKATPSPDMTNPLSAAGPSVLPGQPPQTSGVFTPNSVYRTLEDTAAQLGMSADEVDLAREKLEIPGQYNNGQWEFRERDIDAFRRLRAAGADTPAASTPAKGRAVKKTSSGGAPSVPASDMGSPLGAVAEPLQGQQDLFGGGATVASDAPKKVKRTTTRTPKPQGDMSSPLSASPAPLPGQRGLFDPPSEPAATPIPSTPETPRPKTYLNEMEVAQQLGMSVDAVRRARENGDLRGFQDRGVWRFGADDVESLQSIREKELTARTDDSVTSGMSSPLASEASQSTRVAGPRQLANPWSPQQLPAAPTQALSAPTPPQPMNPWAVQRSPQQLPVVPAAVPPITSTVVPPTTPTVVPPTTPTVVPPTTQTVVPLRNPTVLPPRNATQIAQPLPSAFNAPRAASPPTPTFQFPRPSRNQAVAAGLFGAAAAGYGLGSMGGGVSQDIADPETRALLRLNEGLGGGRVTPPPVQTQPQGVRGDVGLESPLSVPATQAADRGADAGLSSQAVGGALPDYSEEPSQAVRDAQQGYLGDENTAEIDRLVRKSKQDVPGVGLPTYNSNRVVRQREDLSSQFTQGLNILRQQGLRDNPNRAAALLADSQGYDPRVLRSAAQSLGGYDTRYRPGSEFNPGLPIGGEEMSQIRANEQYRRGAMTTPGGLMSRYGRGGPLGLQALAAQQSERDAEQAARMRSRMAADQQLLDMSNPMTEAGLTNITDGRMPAAPNDPFQRRSTTFAYQDPRNISANNPLGTTGTNRLGMLRMMNARGELESRPDLADELAREEEAYSRGRDRRSSEPYRSAVREILQTRAANKQATAEDRALSRYLKQGYSPMDPFLQQRYPKAVQRWADSLGAGQQQAYGLTGDATPSSEMESPLVSYKGSGAATVSQLQDAGSLLAHLTAGDDEYQPVDYPGYDVFDAYRNGQPGAFADPRTIEDMLQSSLAGGDGSVSLTEDNLRALQMYAKALSASPQYSQYFKTTSIPGLSSLVGADLTTKEGVTAFQTQNMRRLRENEDLRRSRAGGRTYGLPSGFR